MHITYCGSYIFTPGCNEILYNSGTKAVYLVLIMEMQMRLQRLESFRVYSMLVIVFAHAQFAINFAHASFTSDALKFCFVTVPRFTMPYFFILSGYFIGGKIIQDEAKAVTVAIKYTKKLFLLYLLWWIIYLFEVPLMLHDYNYGIIRPAYWELMRLLRDDPVRMIMLGAGSGGHLWFLTTLIVTVWIFALFALKKKTGGFMYLGIIMYIFGLLCGPYKFLSLGLDLYRKPAYFVIFSILFFSIGVAFHNKLPRISKKMALGITFLGLAIYCSEAYFIWHQWALSPLRNDFLVGTIPFGVGVFLLAFKQADSNLDNLLGPYGKFIIGVYLSHMIFIDILKPYGDSMQPIVWQFMLPIMSFTCALCTTIIFSKTKLAHLFGVDVANQVSGVQVGIMDRAKKYFKSHGVATSEAEKVKVEVNAIAIKTRSEREVDRVSRN